MKTFEQVYAMMDDLGSPTSFALESAQKLYACLRDLKEKDVVVEVGVQFGRSSTMIGELARDIGFTYIAIDNYQEDVSEQALNTFKDRIEKFNLKVDLRISTAKKEASSIKEIAVIHIDGDHTYEGVCEDINSLLPKVKKGGFALFHDYGHDGLPGVKQAVDELVTNTKFWDFLGVYHSLAVFRRRHV